MLQSPLVSSENTKLDRAKVVGSAPETAYLDPLFSFERAHPVDVDGGTCHDHRTLVRLIGSALALADLPGAKWRRTTESTTFETSSVSQASCCCIPDSQLAPPRPAATADERSTARVASYPTNSPPIALVHIWRPAGDRRPAVSLSRKLLAPRRPREVDAHFYRWPKGSHTIGQHGHGRKKHDPNAARA